MTRSRRSSWLASLLLALTFLCLAASDAFAQAATTLGDLFAGDSLIVEDKLFDSWVELSNSVQNDVTARTAVDPFNIVVTPWPGDPLNPGFEFTPLANELSITQSGALGASLDLAFRFDVTVLDPTKAWVDNTLVAFYDPGVSGDGGNNREAHIHEFLFTDDTLTTLFGDKDSHYINDDGLGVEDQSGIVASAVFPGRTFGTVLKDIDLSTETDGESVGIISFEQHFSQIPEPSSFLLVAAGMMGASFFGRRRRRRS